MKRELGAVILISAVLLLCLAATRLYAGCGKAEADEKESEVAIANVPAAVAATLQAQAQGGTIDEIEKIESDGLVTYEADITIGADEWECKVSADGSLISMLKEDDEEDRDED